MVDSHPAPKIPPNARSEGAPDITRNMMAAGPSQAPRATSTHRIRRLGEMRREPRDNPVSTNDDSSYANPHSGHRCPVGKPSNA